MEDVLAVYARPPDPARPLVCFDESGKELHGHKRRARCRRPGPPRPRGQRVRPRRQRQSVPGLRPAPGLARGRASPRGAPAVDFAHAMRDAGRRPVPARPSGSCWSSTTSTPTRPAALYQAFPAAEARRIWSARVALHPQAWLLAEHGRAGTARAGAPMPGPAHPRRRHAGPRGRRLGGGPQPRGVRIDWTFTIAEPASSSPIATPFPEQDTSAVSLH